MSSAMIPALDDVLGFVKGHPKMFFPVGKPNGLTCANYLVAEIVALGGHDAAVRRTAGWWLVGSSTDWFGELEIAAHSSNDRGLPHPPRLVAMTQPSTADRVVHLKLVWNVRTTNARNRHTPELSVTPWLAARDNRAIPAVTDSLSPRSVIMMIAQHLFSRRPVLVAVVAASLASSTPALADPQIATRWVATWATGPAGPNPGTTPQFNDQTVRYIINTSVGGDRVRVKISNTFGADPIAVGAAHIARRVTGARIDRASDRRLTFSGVDHVTIPAGALVVSDPVALDVRALSELAVSLYLPQPTAASTMHVLALQTSYLAAGTGDATAAADLPGAAPRTSWELVTGVDVATRGGGTVVALGDSITDGANGSVDAELRWPNVLAKRLQARPETRRLGVVDQGIIGNRILHPTEPAFENLFGPAGLARFDRDVIAQAGVEAVIVLLGINDIGHPGSSAPASDAVTAEEIEAGLVQFVERGHEHGLKVFGATLTPFENTTLVGFFSPEKEVKRQAVNHWIRTAGKFDAVIDFDAAIRDPGHPARMLPALDSGDHLHPNDAGQTALGNAVPLSLFDDHDR